MLSSVSPAARRLDEFRLAVAEMVETGVMDRIKAGFYRATEARAKHP